MSTRTEGLLLLALMIGLSLIFQVQMKLFGVAYGNAVAKAETWPLTIVALLEVSISWRGAVVLGLAAAQFILWLMVLARLDLSVAISIGSLGLVVSALGGGFWLGEDLSLLRVVGLLATAIGVTLVICS